MAKHGNESRELLQKIQQEKIKGTIGKRFEDEFFALDLLKILYDDSEDAGVKTELLILLEEYGHLGLNHESIDQLVTSLLDIYSQGVGAPANWTFVCQTLITSTSLLVQLQQLDSEICGQLVKKLVAIVTTSVNQPDSQRLRCCACQCLVHMEEFQPGLLVCQLDEFIRLMKQERTQVYQDYALLVAKVMEYSGRMPEKAPESPALLSPSKSMPKFQKSPSIDVQDLRQTAAMMLENAPLFTRCGGHRIMQSLVDLAQHRAEISPMMFKSLLLHQMPTMSCVLLHTVLYIQRQFEGEILTAKEEDELVDRLCIMADHPSLNILHKLLACQWAKTYKQSDIGEPVPHECILQRHRLKFYPSVFDPVDTQLSKLYMTSFCSSDVEPDGVETSILLGSLGYLHKLVWHTGSGRAAIALFKALYYIYTTHNSQAFGTDIQRFVRGLISEFPHFIPHSVDFIDSVRKLDGTSCIYAETLALLHQQVVTATREQVFLSFKFYLQILKKVAVEKTIDQASTVKFLCYLAESAAEMDDSSWKLGHDLLEICRNLLTCHGSQKHFIGERRKSDISQARKRSMHMVYTLENFFVMDPDSVSVPVDSDQDEPMSDDNEGIELQSTDKALSDGSEKDVGKRESICGMDDGLALQAKPVEQDYHPSHICESELANDASVKLEQFHATDHGAITRVDCCSLGQSLNGQDEERLFKECDQTLSNKDDGSLKSRQNEDTTSIQKSDEQNTAAWEVLAEIHETCKPDRNISTKLKDGYQFGNSADEMEGVSASRIASDNDTEERYEESRGVNVDTSETSNLLSKANTCTDIDQDNVKMDKNTGKSSLVNVNVDHDTNAQSEVEMPDSVATPNGDLNDSTYETTTLIDGTSYQDIATSMIEITDAALDTKEEVWESMFRESFQRSVMDVFLFMLIFMVCVIPQLVLDVVNIQADNVDSAVQHGLQVSADVAVSALFLGFTVIFIWRVRVYQG